MAYCPTGRLSYIDKHWPNNGEIKEFTVLGLFEHSVFEKSLKQINNSPFFIDDLFNQILLKVHKINNYDVSILIKLKISLYLLIIVGCGLWKLFINKNLPIRRFFLLIKCIGN